MNRKDVKALGIWDLYEISHPSKQFYGCACIFYSFFNRSARPRAQDLISSQSR
ncbi:MAG: hypothetical protein A4E25_00468 [Methanobacterium sp. PtaB.Bin024]|jgi:hypothetical protein|nr:MAG: hypothetical protein A4E25_00468 [Methanobacterium sp. PtaB.Bin024]